MRAATTAAMLATAMLASGCLPVKVTASERTVAMPSTHTSVPSGTKQLTAMASIDGDELVVVVSHEQTCEFVEVEQVRVYRETVRTEGYPNGLLYEIGLTALAGVVSYALVTNPERACTRTEDDGSVTMDNPETCRTVGQFLGVGAGLMVIAIGFDLYGLRDSVEDLGVRKTERVIGRDPCPTQPLDGSSIEIELLGVAQPITIRTSADGAARISLRDVSPEVLAQLARGIVVEAGGERAQGRLSSGEVSALRDTLAADPDTRYAREHGAQVARERSEAREWLSADQPGLLRSAVTTQPEMLAAVRGDPDLLALIESMVSTAAATLLLEHPDAPANLERYCDARWLMVNLGGDDRWSRLRIDISRRAAAVSDEHDEAEFAAALDTTRCE